MWSSADYSPYLTDFLILVDVALASVPAHFQVLPNIIFSVMTFDAKIYAFSILIAVDNTSSNSFPNELLFTNMVDRHCLASYKFSNC